VSVSKEEIEKIAKLARLNLNEDEINKIESQINQILEYVKKLDELNTDDVEPLSHTLDLNNVFREDVVKESLPREKALENAPLKSDKFFRVPKVIKK
jgi:aspartyl-tRNA(Asn)/glutamyl-tRNA(Gln) amidotransferase subunit C